MIVAALILAVAPSEPRSTSVAWQVDGRGHVLACTVTKTSGDPKIDKKACDFVVKSRPATSGEATINAEEPNAQNH